MSFIAPFPGVNVVSVIYQGSSAVAPGNTSSFSLGSVSVGTPAANRYVIVGVYTSFVAQASVTIGGVPTTLLVANGLVGLWGAALPSGTTASLSVTTSGTSNVCIASIWSVVGIASLTPASTGSASGASPSVSMSCHGGGAIIGITGAFEYNTGLYPSFVWSNLAKDADTNEAYILYRHALSVAHSSFSLAQSSLVCQCSISGTTGQLCAVAYNPA